MHFARSCPLGYLRLPAGAVRMTCTAYSDRASGPLLRRLVRRRFYGFAGGRRLLFLLSEIGRKIGFIPHGRGPGSRLLIDCCLQGRAGGGLLFSYCCCSRRYGRKCPYFTANRASSIGCSRWASGASFQLFYSCHIPAIALRRSAEAVLARGPGSN